MTRTESVKNSAPDWSTEDFRRAIYRAGIPVGLVGSVQANWKRHIAELKDGRSVHVARPYVAAPTQHPVPPTDLLAEGRVLDVLFPYMRQIGVEVPRVLDTRTSSPAPGAPEGVLQIRTWVKGEKLVEAMTRRCFDYSLFLEKFGKMVAHLHACPLDAFGSALPDHDPRGLLTVPKDLTFPSPDFCTPEEREVKGLCDHFRRLTLGKKKTLVHNDLHPENFFVDPWTSAPCGLIDFELSHGGRPPAAEFARMTHLVQPLRDWSSLLEVYNAASTQRESPPVRVSDIVATQGVASLNSKGLIGPGLRALYRDVCRHDLMRCESTRHVPPAPVNTSLVLG